MSKDDFEGKEEFRKWIACVIALASDRIEDFKRQITDTDPDLSMSSIHDNATFISIVFLYHLNDREQEDVVETLLNQGANPDKKDEMGCAALHYAVLYGSVGSIALLLHYGANPSIIDEYDKMPLDYLPERLINRGQDHQVIQKLLSDYESGKKHPQNQILKSVSERINETVAPDKSLKRRPVKKPGGML